MIEGERMRRRDLRSDRLMTPWSKQKENATTGTRPEHGSDNENPGPNITLPRCSAAT
jgi:hypothetical protein